jgi:hypothetical protein
MRISPVGAKLLNEDGQTDGHDGANNSFFAVSRKHQKTNILDIKFYKITLKLGTEFNPKLIAHTIFVYCLPYLL